MEHKEYRRIISNSNVAILFIHGIVGTPNHFNEFVPLVPENVSVFNMLLDGHGKGVSDFSKSSMKKWETQVSNAVEELSSTHKEIFIVAHSMGTLLAMEQAIGNPKITKLFLLAVPLKISLKYKMFINSCKVFLNRIEPDDYEALAAEKSYSIERDKNLFKYFGWIPRFLELFAKIRQIRESIKRLQTSCCAYQSGKDEMVSKQSIKYLKQNPDIEVVILKNAGHYYYDETDQNFLLHQFKRLFNDA